MGLEDVERQKLNVFRMELSGARVLPVKTGSRTLKDAINDAFRDWVATVDSTHYLIGSTMGPHPYPTMVKHFQSVIGRETRKKFSKKRVNFLMQLLLVLEGEVTPWEYFQDL